MTCMSHDPESRVRHEIAASDDSNTEPALPQPGGVPTPDGPVDPDGAAERPRPSHDPYQPL
jgi:hypothetical protein